MIYQTPFKGPSLIAITEGGSEMKGKSKETFYFERPGPVNTEKALELGIDRGESLGVKNLVIPSITGESALKATKLCER